MIINFAILSTVFVAITALPPALASALTLSCTVSSTNMTTGVQTRRHASLQVNPKSDADNLLDLGDLGAFSVSAWAASDGVTILAHDPDTLFTTRGNPSANCVLQQMDTLYEVVCDLK